MSFIPNKLASLLFPGKPVWVKVRSGLAKGMWMQLDLQREERVWRGDHEPLLQRVLQSTVTRGFVVYDVGAHIGSIALGLARQVGLSGRVVAFEAEPANVERLKKNRDRNRLTNSLDVIPSAVWSGSSDAVAFRRGGEKMTHGGVEVDGQRPVLGTGELITVSTISLDNFVASGGPIPHLVKIDVEGGEYEVLLGGKNLFSTHHPLIIAEVHHSEAENRIRTWLATNRYMSRWVAPPEKLPCSVFAWADSYEEGDWPWTSESD